MQYNVLWVDDHIKNQQAEGEIDFNNAINTAYKKYALRIKGVETLEEAKIELEQNYDQYEAVILDWKGKEKKTDADHTSFLSLAIGVLQELKGENTRPLPWYVFSRGAGAIDNIEDKKNDILRGRSKMDEIWGPGYYEKDGEGQNALFTQIQKVIQDSPSSKIRELYSDVFEELSVRDRWNKDASTILFDIFKAHHEGYKKFKSVLHYTRLRLLVEYLFRAYHKLGVIPSELINENNKGVNIAECSLFLKGEETKYEHGGYKWRLAQPIHKKHLADWLWEIIRVGNNNSHTQEFTILSQVEQQQLEQAFDESNMKYQIFIYALQLSEMIRALHQFAVYHPCAEDNKQLIERIDVPEESKIITPKGEEFTIEYDHLIRKHHAGICLLLSRDADSKIGRRIRIDEVTKNKDEASPYKWFCPKFTIID